MMDDILVYGMTLVPDVNAENEYGKTVLMIASEEGNWELFSRSHRNSDIKILRSGILDKQIFRFL